MSAVPPSLTSKNLSSSFSCSPVLNRPTNSHSRNSEINNHIRRSFAGTPFAKPSSVVTNHRATGGGGGFNHNTPVNSPSDYSRRSSEGRDNETVSFDQEDKENGRDHNSNPSRVRSPATSSKGTKNFMSPTISAASKFNPSRRKRILTDKSESIRTSVSLAEVKGSLLDESESKPSKSHSQKKEVSFDTKVTYIENKEVAKSDEGVEDPDVEASTKDHTDWWPGSVSGDKDCVNLDPSFEISPRTTYSVPSPSLAPLDADPLITPYDPKTNYLSPRPQFLHYKPNPRVELYRDGKQLEETFESECFSDAEVTEEETKSEDSQKETEEASLCFVAKEEESGEVQQQLIESESNPINYAEVVAKEKTTSKRQSACRRGLIGFLLVLAIACVWISIINSSVLEPTVINNLSFSSPYVPAEISEFMRSSFKDLAQKFHLWFQKIHSHISNLIVSLKDRHKISHYANLSTLVEYDLVDSYQINHFIVETDTTYNQNVGALTRKEEYDDDYLDKEEELKDEFCEGLEEVKEVVEHNNLEDLVKVEVFVPEGLVMTLQSEVIEPVVGEAKRVAADDNVPTKAGVSEFGEENKAAEADRIQADAYTDSQSETSFNDQPLPIPEAASTAQPEVLDATQIESVTDQTSIENEFIISEDILDSIISDSSVEIFLTGDRLKGKFSSKTLTFGISLITLTLLAALAFKYMNIASPALKNSKAPEAGRVTSKPDYNPKAITKSWPTEVDTVSEACPSETSSYRSSSIQSKRGLKGSSETRSQDRRRSTKNHRRESLDSSDYSMSSSYGSFTTYERIPIKHDNGDQEEMITPVRRSSRIRNQVISS